MGSGPFLGQWGGKATRDGEAIPVVAIAPLYPRQALIQGLQGWVKLQFTINEDGTVSNPAVVAAEPANVFNQAALRAVTRWKFKPTVVDGKAVQDTGTYTIKFRIE